MHDEICEGESLQMRIGVHIGEVAEMNEQNRGDGDQWLC